MIARRELPARSQGSLLAGHEWIIVSNTGAERHPILEFFGIVMVIIVPVLDVPLNLIKLMLIIINDSCIRKLQTI